eukprot:c5897_g1_i1.p1 GENE.c5897_g1_i1~~c5897_g1_i1.p1  ORF type:complete len:194 (-),score=31.65 c5897_g1_i1:79-660(-)
MGARTQTRALNSAMAVLAKLVIVLLRQISKPVSNQIKNAAKSKTYLHTGLARFGKLSFAMEHRLNIILGNTNEPMALLAKDVAVQRGADVLGEIMVFGVAAVATVTEYVSKSKKDAAKEAAKDKKLEDQHIELTHCIEALQKSVQDLSVKLAESEEKVKHLIDEKIRDNQTVAAAQEVSAPVVTSRRRILGIF